MLIPNAIVVLQVIITIALQVKHVVYIHKVRHLNSLQFLKLSLYRILTYRTSCKRFSGAFQA